MNSKHSTKQHPSGTKLRISTICRLVIALGAVKALVLASLILPDQDTGERALPESTTIILDRLNANDASPAEAAGSPRIALSPGSATADRQEPSVPEGPASVQPMEDQKPLALAQEERQAMSDTIAEASARSAMSLPTLFGPSLAQAADLPPLSDIIPPAPSLRSIAESAQTPAPMPRPDETAPGQPPAPAVGSFVSRDSAAQKQAELNRKEQELMALQQQMEARINELHNLENRLQGMIYDANTAQDSKFGNLISMYANMKPRVAAQALTTMDEAIAVRILTGMKSKESGEILSYMDPRHAARLSEVMSKMQI